MYAFANAILDYIYYVHHVQPLSCKYYVFAIEIKFDFFELKYVCQMKSYSTWKDWAYRVLHISLNTVFFLAVAVHHLWWVSHGSGTCAVLPLWLHHSKDLWNNIIRWSIVYGYSYHEISDLAHCSIGTVSNILHAITPTEYLPTPLEKDEVGHTLLTMQIWHTLMDYWSGNHASILMSYQTT